MTGCYLEQHPYRHPLTYHLNIGHWQYNQATRDKRYSAILPVGNNAGY